VRPLPNSAALLLMVLSGCAFDVHRAPTEPELSCRPGSVDVVVIVAPEAVDIPECTEMALDVPKQNIGNRQWCCSKGDAPSIGDIAEREIEQRTSSHGTGAGGAL
jgi:hypothetical protein